MKETLFFIVTDIAVVLATQADAHNAGNSESITVVNPGANASRYLLISGQYSGLRRVVDTLLFQKWDSGCC